MEEEFGSLAKFLYDTTKYDVKFDNYDLSNTNIPFIMIPQPETTVMNSSLDSFKRTSMLFVKIFDESSEKAMRMANKIIVELAFNRWKIPLFSEEGVLLERKFSIKNAQISRVDEGIAQVKIIWDSHLPYNKENPVKIMKFFISQIVKNKGGKK